MAKTLRFAPPDGPVHVWIRGNQKQDVFFTAGDRQRYLDLLARHSMEQRVEILGYCLMTNHVHLVLKPTVEDSLSWMMMGLNAEYAQCIQFKLDRRGHLWQGRFCSSVMDDPHFWAVMRYVELNPVRANLVPSAELWPWSSAAAHTGRSPWPTWLETQPFCSGVSAAEWAERLKTPVNPRERALIWRATRMNRPLASPAKIETWETQFSVSLRPGRPGRPKRQWLGSTNAAGA